MDPTMVVALLNLFGEGMKIVNGLVTQNNLTSVAEVREAYKKLREVPFPDLPFGGHGE